MSYDITHLHGAMESDPPLDALEALLDELEDADIEHTDVSVTHESEWCLSCFRGGLVIWENLEGNEPRHINHMSRDKIVELLVALAHGDLDRINREAWNPGYGG